MKIETVTTLRYMARVGLITLHYTEGEQDVTIYQEVPGSGVDRAVFMPLDALIELGKAAQRFKGRSL